MRIAYPPTRSRLLLAMLIGLSGLLALAAEPTAAGKEASAEQADADAMQQVANVLEQMQSAMQRDQKYYQELFKRQGNELQAFAEAIRQLDTEMGKLRQRVAALEAENARLRANATPPTPAPATTNPEVKPAPLPGAGVASHSPRRYQVQQGDTLTAIAKATNVTVAALKEANKLENDKIQIGQTLQIPEP
jgi:LysM repeat protein